MNFARITQTVMRPGASDLACVGLLIIGSIVGPTLEPSHRDLWTLAPLVIAAPILVAGVLQCLSSQIATLVAGVIHALLFLLYSLGLLLSAFLFVTVLFAGTAVVLAPVCLLLALNSAFTLTRVLWQRKGPRGGSGKTA